jgi:hypothetical protein
MRRRGKRESGQALVLGALLLLVVAGTLLATLNLGNAVHERIRLQNAADAQAHALAVLEARAFNLFANSNRALASAYVSLVGVHAYHSATSYAVGLYDATLVAMGVAASAETAAACLSSGCTNARCLAHAAAIATAGTAFYSATRDRAERAAKLEGPFRSSVAAIEGMIDGQIALQETMKAFVSDAVARGGGDALRSLAETNAPAAHFDDPVAGSLSARSFARAFEGNQQKKAAILREIANGSRWGGAGSGFDPDCNFLVNRGDLSLFGGAGRLGCQAANIALFAPTLVDINKNIKGCRPMARPGSLYGGSMTTTFVPGYEGTALLGDRGASATELPAAPTGRIRKAQKETAILAADSGGVISFQCFEWPGFSLPVYSNELATEPGSGTGVHAGPGFQEKEVHSGTHRYRGLTTRFMEFHPVSRPAGSQGSLAPGEGIDGQPVTYVIARQDLGLVARDDGSFSREQAWETNESGELGIGKARLGLAPAGEGVAVGKAMAYYHRPGAWKEGPNFWFPYWRAKLHPLSEEEARTLASAAGSEAGEAAAAAARAIGGPRYTPTDVSVAR